MYHLFAGYNYYPQNGLGDYVYSYETLEEAEEAGREQITAASTDEWYLAKDWYIVIAERDGSLVEVTSRYN